MPKAELHCHLEGIVDPAMARSIRQADPTFPLDPEALEQAYPVEGFESFFRWWYLVYSALKPLDQYGPILERHIERLKAQGVRYVEVTFAVRAISPDRTAAVEQVAAFRDRICYQEGEDIQIEFLVGIGRHRPPENVAQLADAILALHEAGTIVGVSIGGPEPGHPIRPHRRTLARFHEAGLGIAIHAGEWCGPESVWDALQYGYPDRIGHGVSLFQDDALVDLVRERGIHVEMCLTSNLKSGSVAHIEKHPVGRARDLGLHFSINTDDPGAFECSLVSEYELLSRQFGFDDRDFQRIYEHALVARFQPELRVRNVTVR